MELNMSPSVNTTQQKWLAHRTLSKIVHRFTVSLFQEFLLPSDLNILSLTPPKHLRSFLRPRITDKCFLATLLPGRSPHKLLTFLGAHPSPRARTFGRSEGHFKPQSVRHWLMKPQVSLSASVGWAGAIGSHYTWSVCVRSHASDHSILTRHFPNSKARACFYLHWDLSLNNLYLLQWRNDSVTGVCGLRAIVPSSSLFNLFFHSTPEPRSS